MASVCFHQKQLQQRPSIAVQPPARITQLHTFKCTVRHRSPAVDIFEALFVIFPRLSVKFEVLNFKTGTKIFDFISCKCCSILAWSDAFLKLNIFSQCGRCLSPRISMFAACCVLSRCASDKIQCSVTRSAFQVLSPRTVERGQCSSL